MNKLTDAISILYDMEMNNYFMTKTINELKEAADELGIEQKINKPIRVSASFSSSLISSCSISLVICAVLGVIFGIIGGVISNSNGFFESIFGAIAGAICFGLIGAAIGLVLGIITSFFVYLKNVNTANKANSIRLEDYNRKKVEYQQKLNNEYKAKEIILCERNNLIKRKQEAITVLNDFYSVVGIAPEFRNLIPIGYMYNFSRLGISTKLEGVDGLYYLINKELRMDQLQYSLEDISKKMDTIIDNQHRIYTELTHINAKCDTIISQTQTAAFYAAENNVLLQNAVMNTYITSYTAKRIEKELSYSNFMNNY